MVDRIGVYKKNQQNRITEVSIEAAFPFLQETNHVISLVGGGGKTTLMYTLADAAGKKGMHAIATTTTHIRKPEHDILSQRKGKQLPGGKDWQEIEISEPYLWARNEAELHRLWQQGLFAVAGQETSDEKLTMPEPEQLAHFMKLADITFIEADGAKGRPCKAPAGHEPVLLPESDIVIGVMGLDALGRPIAEVCFRVEQVCRLLGKTPEEIVTAQDMVRILNSENGTRKNVGNREYYIVLNKYDLLKTQEEVEQAENIMEMLQWEGILNVILNSL